MTAFFVKVTFTNSYFLFSVIESVVNPNHNPFTIPHDNDVFMLRDKERQRKKQVSSSVSNYVKGLVRDHQSSK